MSRGLRQIADEMWGMASKLKQIDKDVADEVAELATEVHEHWERLREALGGDAE